MGNKNDKTFLDQLEDGCVKAMPACGGIVGALIGIGILKDTAQPILAAALGGMLGGVLLGLITLGVFRVINPNRNRGQMKKKDW